MIALNFHAAVFIGEAVAAEKFAHTEEHGLLVRNILETQIFGQAGCVELFDKLRMGEKGLDFRGEEEYAVFDIVIKGLNAEDIPCAEDFVCFRIPYDE
ncbi:MAG: hypothetical protein BWY37_01932 [Firmicutes bacterium ADurb.Bin262]|nr:MAG: hypothetical protein BWY37_01932 [Firmicutes bacterium ADurb.Bin262]